MPVIATPFRLHRMLKKIATLSARNDGVSFETCNAGVSIKLSTICLQLCPS